MQRRRDLVFVCEFHKLDGHEEMTTKVRVFSLHQLKMGLTDYIEHGEILIRCYVEHEHEGFLENASRFRVAHSGISPV
jgi:hypothetical protein